MSKGALVALGVLPNTINFRANHLSCCIKKILSITKIKPHYPYLLIQIILFQKLFTK